MSYLYPTPERPVQTVRHRLPIASRRGAFVRVTPTGGAGLHLTLIPPTSAEQRGVVGFALFIPMKRGAANMTSTAIMIILLAIAVALITEDK